MKLLLITFITFLMSSSFSTSAKSIKKPAPRRSVSQTAPAHILTVTAGEKITTFEIKAINGAGRVMMSSNLDPNPKLRDLSIKDMDFVRLSMQDIAGQTDPNRQCYRSSIMLKYEGRNYWSCLNEKSRRATKMQELANLLAFIF